MDYYQTLGVAKNATPDDIKKAYRKLASQHHPDKGGDTVRFQEIRTAYDTCSDPAKREQYDSPMPQGMPGGFHFNANGFDLNEIFSQVFAQQHQARQRNQIFRTTVPLSLEESYHGKHHTLNLQTPLGSKVVNITIPKGIKSGDQIKYDGIIEGATLLIMYEVTPHIKFDRKGNDLYCNVPISVLDLIVGTTFEFTTISGKTLEVAVQPKTQPYMQLKINSQGMPVYNSPAYGDQILLLKPYIPDIIDNQLFEVIKKFKDSQTK